MTEFERPLNVFLCHAHIDRDTVKALDGRVRRYQDHTHLTKDGVDVWPNKENPCGERSRTILPWAGRRLPTEAEWEKAASWNDQEKTKYLYPSGNTIDCSTANFAGCIGNTDITNRFKERQSPYGVADMAGNVWEWVSSLYQPYPYSAADGRENSRVTGQRVLRGGSWSDAASNIRSTVRAHFDPSYSSNNIGFRCAMDANP